MRYIDLIREFFRPQTLAGIASIVGIMGGINSLTNSGGGGYSSNQGSNAPPFYIPQGQGVQDSNWQSALAQLFGQTSSAAGQINPAEQQSFQAGEAVNPQGFATSGAQAGQQYGSAANLAQMFSQLMQGQAQQGQQQQAGLIQAGNDPNKAMYNKELAQTIDTSRAADSARGIAGGPVSSGNESTAVQNFNTNWDYSQLQRILAANQGVNQTGQLIGADAAASQGFAGQVPGLTLQGGAAPIQGAQAAAAYPGQVASSYQTQTTAAGSPWNSIMNSILPYLNFGQGATNSAFGGFSQNQQNQQNQSAAGTNALLTGLGQANTSANTPGSWLSSIFGGGGGGGMMDPYSGISSGSTYSGSLAGI